MEAEVPLIGLARERELVAEAIEQRQSLLLIGPRASGKSRVLREVLARRPEALHLTCPAAPHALLASLAQQMGMDSRLSSVRLRGLLWNALEASPRILVLDAVQNAGHALRRFFERLYYIPGMAILVAARDHGALGALNRLFWDPRRLVRFEPLGDKEAYLLFEAAADRFSLRELDLDEFREQVLESARGNPGEIVEMCRRASDPRYLAGVRIKFVPLRIDALIKLAR
jgi:hypothetical protein